MSDDLQFLPLRKVIDRVGLSKSEIYRRISENRFPAGRSYGDGATKRFWLASEVKAWQEQVLSTH